MKGGLTIREGDLQTDPSPRLVTGNPLISSQVARPLDWEDLAMNHGATNGIMLVIAWLVLMAVSGLVFNESEAAVAADQTPALLHSQDRQEQLRISPYQKAEESDEENSGGGWWRRRTAFA